MYLNAISMKSDGLNKKPRYLPFRLVFKRELIFERLGRGEKLEKESVTLVQTIAVIRRLLIQEEPTVLSSENIKFKKINIFFPIL